MDDSPLGNAARKFSVSNGRAVFTQTDFQKHKKPLKALLELSYPFHVKMHSSASERVLTKEKPKAAPKVTMFRSGLERPKPSSL